MDTQTITLSATLLTTMTDQQPDVTNNIKTAVPSFFPGRQWQQVLERDSSADGQFVYAVKSTKIFCKPSCPSRRPARKQVSFYPNAVAAEAVRDL